MTGFCSKRHKLCVSGTRTVSDSMCMLFTPDQPWCLRFEEVLRCPSSTHYSLAATNNLVKQCSLHRAILSPQGSNARIKLYRDRKASSPVPLTGNARLASAAVRKQMQPYCVISLILH